MQSVFDVISNFSADIDRQVEKEPNLQLPAWLVASQLRLIIGVAASASPATPPPARVVAKVAEAAVAEPVTAPKKQRKKFVWSPEARARAAERMRATQRRRHGSTGSEAAESDSFPSGNGSHGVSSDEIDSDQGEDREADDAHDPADGLQESEVAAMQITG